MSILSIEDLEKTFRMPNVARETVREHVLGLFRPRRTQEVHALRGVSFTVEPGCAVGIMGRNGSGKSTLMRILAGIYRPDRGRIALGAPVTPILGLGVGWNEALDALDNVYLLGTVLGLTLREVRESMESILAFAELERFAGMPLRHYSSGMKVRLAYAVAFRSISEILLLDEVFAVGDAGFRKRCRERCLELKAAGHTILLVSHDPGEITGFCDRALLLEGGRIVLDDQPERVAHEYLRRLETASAFAAPQAL
jgi:ABC-type polysaccharide/polyol phosphate transport system ATPase subunit